MTYHARADETAEWLNYLQPEGLVVGANVLRDVGLTPVRQTPGDTKDAAEALGLDPEAPREDDPRFALADPWRFFEAVLDWPASLVAGALGGPAVDPALTRTVPEHETLLSPDMALLWHGASEDGVPAQALVMLHPALDPDTRDRFGPSEWEASPHQRLERLLRETGVGVGILVARNTLRLVYAPRGETAGWLSWPLAALGRVEGRPMLAGLKLCLGRNAFFTGAPETRLRTLLWASREAQNAVSDKLSGQVLGALYELLRGLHRAAPDRLEALAASEPHHLYEGLLTGLMRLVFLLYAEDRDLLPSSAEPEMRALWENGYSIKTLYARLLADEALNPDTMDQRRGAWGQLLAVFRLVHEGHEAWVARRGGKLFDPDAFPFLEGRDSGSARHEGEVLPVSDGTVLRILHGLMTIEGRGLSGERVRERLSYRALDVESIGSVYETVMGFTARRAAEPMVALKDEKRLPAFVGLSTLLAQKAAERQRWLKEQSVTLSAKQAKGVKEARTIAALLDALGSAIDRRASPEGEPLAEGAPFLQPTEERRRSGSHYTPRSLTEPIVRHALTPAFARIGEVASPEAVLSLKVLDPACGSGAFLVEACRQLGVRLERAWDMHAAEKPPIPADEDEATHARRLVAQRCLYGVDRNPMAVDLARLSLWLATLAREHEFSFLDHALKAGDSLVGLTKREIAAAHWDASKPQLSLFGTLVERAVGRALEGREVIRNAADDVTLSVQTSRHRRVEEVVQDARDIGDAVVAAFFSADKPRGREADRVTVERSITDRMQPDWEALRAKARGFRAAQGWRPFHWEIEFPEVFARENPGFDAIVGNPPFLGGKRISTELGASYRNWLFSLHDGSNQNADLAGHFFRRTFVLLRRNGVFGLIATNTIAQGDTRAASLVPILKSGGTIARARRREKWPGSATVIISIVHVVKGPISSKGTPNLDGRGVSRVSAYLTEGDLDDNPFTLNVNAGLAFNGCFIYGNGFLFDNKPDGGSSSFEELSELQQFCPESNQIIKPFLGGDEINTDPRHKHHRYVIDFGDMPLRRDQSLRSWSSASDVVREKWQRTGLVPPDFPGSVAADWPEILAIVETKVKPERMAKAATRDAPWWRFWRTRPKLRKRLGSLQRSIQISAAALPHHMFSMRNNDTVFSHKLCVIGSESLSLFCVLSSSLHEIWNRRFGATMGDAPTYNPTDVFETYPFPPGYETDPALEEAGQAYHDHRAALMVEADEGMTKTYNRFHRADERRPAIERLRELHEAMDRAVLRAYGWDDLADTLRPRFLAEADEDDHTYRGRLFWPAEGRDLVLARLLALNAERHAEEVAAGLAPARAGHPAPGDAEDAPALELD